MSNATVENLQKNALKLTITVPHEEMKPFLEEAAKHISEHSTIPGFRPGKAGYEVIAKRVGEMAIYEEALEPIVRKSFLEALTANDIQTVGSPKIDVEKLAPGNDLIFTAEVARMPAVTKLADYASINVQGKTIEIPDKEVDRVLHDLSRMQTKEVRDLSCTGVCKEHKVVVSMNIKKAGVPIQGGQSPNHAIYLSEEYYIPGLLDQLLGMKEGEEKKFTLPFPKEHPQKLFAGENIEFEITLKEIYRLEPPTLDDSFAKGLGQKDFVALKDLLRGNLKAEKDEEERLRVEREMLEKIADASRFEEFPDLLLNEEINKMVHELQHAVEAQGLAFDTYVSNMKKTLADLKLDFTPQALMRIKVALVLQTIAKQENITVEEKEVEKEQDEMAERYEDPEAKKQVYSSLNHEFLHTMLKNRKTIEHLRKIMVKV